MIFIIVMIIRDMVTAMTDDKAVCTVINTPDDGSKHVVCKLPNGRQLDVTIDPLGNIQTRGIFVPLSPTEFRNLQLSRTKASLVENEVIEDDSLHNRDPVQSQHGDAPVPVTSFGQLKEDDKAPFNEYNRYHKRARY